MSKKTKASPRCKQDHTGQTVINFYNHGTVNIDARKNNSRTFKHENNGCTIKTSDNTKSGSEEGDILLFTEKTFVAATRQVGEFMTNGFNLKNNR